MLARQSATVWRIVIRGTFVLTPSLVQDILDINALQQALSSSSQSRKPSRTPLNQTPHRSIILSRAVSFADLNKIASRTTTPSGDGKSVALPTPIRTQEKSVLSSDTNTLLSVEYFLTFSESEEESSSDSNSSLNSPSSNSTFASEVLGTYNVDSSPTPGSSVRIARRHNSGGGVMAVRRAKSQHSVDNSPTPSGECSPNDSPSSTPATSRKASVDVNDPRAIIDGLCIEEVRALLQHARSEGREGE